LPLIILLTPFILRSQGVWSTLSSLPATGRAFSYVFSVGDTGYVCGGLNLGVTQSDFWAYHPGTDTWVQKSTPPLISRQGVTFVINGKAYLCTGMEIGNTTAHAEVWEYDPATDSWTQKNNFPGGARISAFGFAIGNKGYIGGGSFPAPNSFYYDFWEYDPANDSWTQIPNYPLPEYAGFGTFVVNGIGYVVGGLNSASITIPGNKVWSFNPTTNQWTQKNNFPINLGLTTGFSVAGEGYIVNGATQLGSNQQKINSLYKYNALADSWSLQANFPGPVRSSTHALVINNAVYAGQGLGLSSVYYTDWYKYVPAGTSSLHESNSMKTLDAYPNPASNMLMIQGADLSQPVTISDLNGRILKSSVTDPNYVDVSNLPAGLYILNNGQWHKPFTVKH
jgi:N-acetylneuraminic acid mutarotase